MLCSAIIKKGSAALFEMVVRSLHFFQCFMTHAMTAMYKTISTTSKMISNMAQPSLYLFSSSTFALVQAPIHFCITAESQNHSRKNMFDKLLRCGIIYLARQPEGSQVLPTPAKNHLARRNSRPTLVQVPGRLFLIFQVQYSNYQERDGQQ
jgi:hypothetical protein